MRSKFEVNATMVANEFIDRYMTSANGEYVKVYLYVLRHSEREVSVNEIADALNHTESDVKRAITYWMRQGILEVGPEPEPRQAMSAVPVSVVRTGAVQPSVGRGHAGKTEAPMMAEKVVQPGMRTPVTGVVYQGSVNSGDGRQQAEEEMGLSGADHPPAAGQKQAPVQTDRTHYTAEQVGALADKEEFTQLLYIAQKLMGKVFTPRDCEVFAYLYDSLQMSAELLEYLAEYCAQNDHKSIRYLEMVALNWKEQGIQTAEQARGQAASFNSDCFGVMKAFGLNDRRPGEAEVKIIRRWFQEWGFGKELVMEACARTLTATHKPSFPYADRILSDWKKDGIKTMEDVKKRDEKREGQSASAQVAATVPGYRENPAPARTTKNKFHNFEQRNTDYDGMVLERLKQRLGENG